VNQDEVAREFTLPTVASTSQYGLPLNVSRILNIEDGTNNRRLREISSREYDRLYPGTSSSGDARRYYVLGSIGVQTQPASPGTVTVVSDSASDGTSFFIRIQGLDANGVWISEQVTMNGTTNVTTTASFTTVEQVAKSQNSGNEWTGQVTVSDASANVLTRIPKAVTSPNHLRVEFYPIPDAVVSLTVRAMARKPDLFDDDDWPQIHEDFHMLIIDGAGPELMLAAGKPQQAQRMQLDFARTLPIFKGRAQYRPNRVGVFKDVQNAPFLWADDRPLVEGVDFV